MNLMKKIGVHRKFEVMICSICDIYASNVISRYFIKVSRSFNFFWKHHERQHQELIFHASTPFSLENPYAISPSALAIFGIDCSILLLEPITIRTFPLMFFRLSYGLFSFLIWNNLEIRNFANSPFDINFYYYVRSVHRNINSIHSLMILLLFWWKKQNRLRHLYLI